jgi:hypothetical protein
MRRALLAMSSAIGVALVGHGVFCILVTNGAPCLNTLYPGSAPMWICHLARFAFYVALAVPIVWLWESAVHLVRPFAISSAVVAVFIWIYWFVLDPSLMLRAAEGTRFAKWWMERTYEVPFLGELYWGWGFAKYHVWLAGGQGICAAVALWRMSRGASSPQAAEQCVAADERRGENGAARS